MHDTSHSDQKQIVAVGCSQSKKRIDRPLPAADRYEGGYWTVKRRYGERVGYSWRIISARYGVLNPTKPILDYDMEPGDLRDVQSESEHVLYSGEEVKTLLDEWVRDVGENLRSWVQSEQASISDPVRLHIIVGNRYYQPLADGGVIDLLRELPSVDVFCPFQEIGFEGNGKQMSWMNSQIAAAEDHPSLSDDFKTP